MKAWLELARISNLPTAWTNVTAAWCLAGGAMTGSWWAALIAASAMYIGGMILNDAVDFKFDQHHRPDRPLPSRRVSLKAAWTVGLGLLVLGAWTFILGAGAQSKWVMALAGAILIYDFYHKPWTGSIWVMGACRTLLYLATASCLLLEFTQEVILRSIVLGLYIVGLTLFARGESGDESDKRKLSSVLGMLGLASPAILSLYLYFTQFRSLFTTTGQAAAYFATVILFVVWIARAMKLMKSPPRSNIGKSVGLLLAGIVCVDAQALALNHPLLGLGFILLVPVLMLWQRKIAAT